MNSQQKKASKTLAGMAIGAGLLAVCPPAALALGLASFLKGARRFAQTGDIDAAGEMLSGYSDATGITSSTKSKK